MVDTFKLLITTTAIAAMTVAHPVGRQESTATDTGFLTTATSSFTEASSTSATATVKVSNHKQTGSLELTDGFQTDGEPRPFTRGLQHRLDAHIPGFLDHFVLYSVSSHIYEILQ